MQAPAVFFFFFLYQHSSQRSPCQCEESKQNTDVASRTNHSNETAWIATEFILEVDNKKGRKKKKNRKMRGNSPFCELEEIRSIFHTNKLQRVQR